MAMVWEMVGRRRLVVLFVFSRALSWFWRPLLEVSVVLIVICFLQGLVLGRNATTALQFGFFDHCSEILIFSVGMEWESALKEKACFSFLLLAACFVAMLGRVWCGLTLVVSCPRFGFQPLHAQLLAVAMLKQFVSVGVFVFSIVFRSLASLAGYVQSKGESKSFFLVKV